MADLTNEQLIALLAQSKGTTPTARPNAIQAMGAGMAGFAAPFIGQNWTNPYPVEKKPSNGISDYNDILKLQETLGVEGRKEDFSRFISELQTNEDYAKKAAEGYQKFTSSPEQKLINEVLDNRRLQGNLTNQAIKEERIQSNQKMTGIFNYGGTIKQSEVGKANEALGYDVSTTLEQAGVKKRNPVTGEVEYILKPGVKSKWEEAVGRGTFTPTEVETLSSMYTEQKEWEDVRKQLNGFDFENIATTYGDKKGWDRFSLAVQDMFEPNKSGNLNVAAKNKFIKQYQNDPKFNALAGQLERIFNLYRKRITGAQASIEEIQWLRESIPNLTQNPDILMAMIDNIQAENKRQIGTRLDSYSSMGRDVDAYKELALGGKESAVKKVSNTSNGNLSDDEAWALYQKKVGK